MYNPIITETFKRSTKYPWYEDFNEERMSYVDEDKNIIVHDGCVNMSQEDNSQYIPFVMSRYYQGIDLMDMLLQIHFVNSKLGTNDSTPINVEYSDNNICFGWLVDRNATFVDGELTFEIRAIGAIQDENGNEVDYVWKTRANRQIKIEKSLSTDNTFAPTQDWYVELIQVINNTDKSTNDAKDAAKASERSAQTYANNAKTSETNAKTSESNAKTSETNAKSSETSAQESATQAAQSAAESQEWCEKTEDMLDDLVKQISDETTRATFAESEIATRIDNMNLALTAEVSRSTDKDTMLDDRITEANGKIADTNSRIADTNSRIAETNTALSNETLRAQGKENELSAKVDKNATDIASIKEDIAEINGDITTINGTLATKANATDVTNAMALKLDVTTFNSAIATKADATTVSTLSNTVSALSTTVADKANVSDLELKADKTYVDEALDTINTTVGTKADKSYVDEALSDINTTLDTKADNETVGQLFMNVDTALQSKADTTTVSTLSETVNGLSETVENKADVSHAHSYIHIGTEEPTDEEVVLWVDTVNGLKYYDGTAWVNVPMASNT